MCRRSVAGEQERLDLLLAAAGHDMRAPLGGVRAAASILASDSYDLQPEQFRALATDIMNEVDRLTILIDGLLDVQRLHAEKLCLATAPVRVQDVLNQAVSRFRSISRRVDVAVDSTLTMVDIDVSLLQHVIANLIVNAMAVTCEEGIVKVQVYGGADGLRIAVIDHGPGISVGDRERIFRLFESSALSNRASGFGLAIAARFVEAMSGRVFISDTLGGGTTMTIHLPATVGMDSFVT